MSEIVFYMDETGNRKADKMKDATRKGRDWFAFGGLLINSEDIPKAKTLHVEFCKEWGIRTPFHLTDMLGYHKNFRWMDRKPLSFKRDFWSAYSDLITSIEATGQACVIDRQKYFERGYVEKHSEDPWSLCRSAFDITVERAVKFAIYKERKLRIVFESDGPFNPIVKGYFKNLKENGLEFNKENSGKYNPLKAEDFAKTLTTIETKDKTSKMLQFADTYVYSIARHKYDAQFFLGRNLRDRGRTMGSALGGNAQLIKEMGVKYYCF